MNFIHAQNHFFGRVEPGNDAGIDLGRVNTTPMLAKGIRYLLRSEPENITSRAKNLGGQTVINIGGRIGKAVSSLFVYLRILEDGEPLLSTKLGFNQFFCTTRNGSFHCQSPLAFSLLSNEAYCKCRVDQVSPTRMRFSHSGSFRARQKCVKNASGAVTERQNGSGFG